MAKQTFCDLKASHIVDEVINVGFGHVFEFGSQVAATLPVELDQLFNRTEKLLLADEVRAVTTSLDQIVLYFCLVSTNKFD